MPWYKVTLSHEDIAALKGIRLQEAFADLFVAYGGPNGAAMFSEPTIGVHEYYFSPAAAELAEVLIAGYNGTPCDAPARRSVHILVSHAGADDVPFAPEE